jgi:hypothetical protein
MTRVLLVTLLAVTAVAAERTPGPLPDGMPFGKVEEADVDRLQDFAVKHGCDLKAEMAGVYSPDNKLDEDALGRVFALSRHFETLDKNARTYGQIIYSSLLNVGEQIGVPAYAKIIDRQPADVQQRVRDFLFYPFTRHPKFRAEDVLKECGEIYPGLFPMDFKFGRNDPIFAKEI